jgi:hypothetical protein
MMCRTIHTRWTFLLFTLFLVPLFTSTHVDAAACLDVIPPMNGAMGSCNTTMLDGTSCSFRCLSGYVISPSPSITTCIGGTVLSQTCQPCDMGNYYLWYPTSPLMKYVGSGWDKVNGYVYQGASVSITANGSMWVTGGYQDANALGSAWTWKLNSSNIYQPTQPKIVGTGSSGTSVALSGDGIYLVVGSPDDGTRGTAQIYKSNGAGIYVSLQTKLTPATGVDFGQSVAFSANGNTLAIGDYSDAAGIGACWIYTLNIGTGLFSLTPQKLVGTGYVGTTIYQGYSVSLSAAGDVVALGGCGDDGSIGAVWVYQRSGGSFSSLQSKMVGTGGIGAQLQAISVSLSGDGLTLAVGGGQDNGQIGAVWIWSRPTSSSTFTQQGSNLVGYDGTVGGYQGLAVSLNYEGDKLLVGGSFDSSSNGATFIWSRINGVWYQQGNKLVNTGSIGAATQARSLAISADSLRIIIGAPGDSASTGAVFAGSISSNCPICPMNFYCPDPRIPPIPCPAGRSGFINGQTSMASACYLPCPAGSYQLGTATACISCTIGRYGSLSAQTSFATACPDICPAGKFGNQTGQTNITSCYTCPAGNFCTGADNSTVCSLGSFCSAGSVLPTPCNAGKFCPDPSISIDCPSGSYSASTSLTSATQCVQCESGRYGMSTGQTSLVSACPSVCAAGKVGSLSGQTSISSCITCSIGSYCSGGNQSIICNAGTLCPSGASAPLSCPSGSYCPTPDVGAINCPAGRFSAATNLIAAYECTACEIGRYGNITGQTSLNTGCASFCAAGTVGTVIGQTNATGACVTCTAGNACSGGNSSIACTMGRLCLTGTVTPMDCPSGSYCSTPATQQPCPLGRWSNETALTISTDCMLCPPSTYGIIDGQSIQTAGCSICSAGQVCIGDGFSAPCSLGSFCRSGSINAQPCPAGSWSSQLNATDINACILCTAGKYGNVTGQSTESAACISCPINQICSGGNNINTCADGSFSFNGGLSSQTQCDACVVNSFCVNGSIIPCPFHTYSSIKGAVSDAVCLSDCDLPALTSLANGIGTGNCSLEGTLHAGQECSLELQRGYLLINGSLDINCSLSSMLKFDSPVTVQRSPLQVIVTGVSTAAVEPSNTIILDASNSFDPEDDTTVFIFQWRCYKGNDTINYTQLPTCNVSAGGINSYTQSTLTINPYSLSSSTTYQIECEIRSADGRIATTHVSVIMMAACPISVPIHGLSGNCSTILLTASTCILQPAFGYRIGTGSTQLSCLFGILSPLPTFIPVVPPPIVSLSGPTNYEIGSAVVLEFSALAVSGTGLAADSSSLTYDWSYISVSDASAGQPVTVLAGSKSATFQLDPSFLSPDTTYNVMVRVIDTNPAHGGTDGAAPFTVQSTSLYVQPIRPAVVEALVGVDPCMANPSFQCYNGGTCVATETNPGSRSYLLSCACPSTPVKFYGARCSFALLECPACTSRYIGGNEISVYGIALDTALRITVAEHPVTFHRALNVNTSSIDATTQAVLSRWPAYDGKIQRMTFISPALVTVNLTALNITRTSRALLQSAEAGSEVVVNPPSAYKLLTLSTILLADSQNGELLELNFTSLLFYSSSNCIEPGQFKADGAGGCLNWSMHI